MKKVYTENDFEIAVKNHVFKELKQVAKNWGGLHKLTSCFLMVPDKDCGLNYNDAEGARRDINDELSVGEIKIEIFDVNFDEKMKLNWMFEIYANIKNSNGSRYSIHRMEFDENALIYHDLYHEEGLMHLDENENQITDWNLIYKNFKKSIK